MPQTKEQKVKNAKILLDNRAKLTPQEQLAKLDKMFGVGQGAKKERNRLNNIINSQKK